MRTAICCVPVSPLRAEPSHRSEMVSQQLFGEVSEIIGSAEDRWQRVRCLADGYFGWCTENHLSETSGLLSSSSLLSSEWVNEIAWNGQSMQIPLGCPLPGLIEGRAKWGVNELAFYGPLWDPATAAKDHENIRRLVFRFLNTPYLWGGRSVFGIDCSGFSQTVMRFFGIPLLRDAWQQATQGEVVGFLQLARIGDLAFFDNAEGKITHVGILLNEHEIIHSSGQVRVDKIDNMGIVHAGNGRRTHHLRLIKRYLPS